MITSKTKINGFFYIFLHSRSPSGTLHSEKLKKTFILAFEETSALSYQNGLFFCVLAHCTISKKNFLLQVVVLSDQVDTQCEKIGDLEKLLDDKKEVLRRTEDILQREMINRSALETKKLELMSDLASLKLRQAAIEKENMELRKKLAKTLHQLQIPPSTSDLQPTVSDYFTQ